jgi:hypothetical protein
MLGSFAIFEVIRTTRSQRRLDNTEERFPAGLHRCAACGISVATRVPLS